MGSNPTEVSCSHNSDSGSSCGSDSSGSASASANGGVSCRWNYSGGFGALDAEARWVKFPWAEEQEQDEGAIDTSRTNTGKC